MTYKIILTEEQIKWACDQTNSARAASETLGVSYQTFIRRCKELGVYKPNQAGKGIHKRRPSIPIAKILSNEIFVTGSHLKRRLLLEGLKKNQCEICKIDSWLDQPLTCQLDHVDGDRSNNKLENLRMLCPNCHSQTPTFSKGKFRI